MSTRDTESNLVIHHMGASDAGNYGTLCLVSTDDEKFEWVDTMPGQKVTCRDCAAIWSKAHEYRASDIYKTLN